MYRVAEDGYVHFVVARKIRNAPGHLADAIRVVIFMADSKIWYLLWRLL